MSGVSTHISSHCIDVLHVFRRGEFILLLTSKISRVVDHRRAESRYTLHVKVIVACALFIDIGEVQ